MSEARKHLALKLLWVSCLAAGLCKGFTTTNIKASVLGMSNKNAATEASGKHKAQQSTWKRAFNDTGIPKHVLKLMQRLSLDGTPFQEHSNLVRGYLPTLNFACMTPVYGFSMKRHQSEAMRALYLHFFAPEPDIQNTRFIDIQLHSLSDKSSACEFIDVLQRPIENRGWQVVDLTSKMSDFINASESHPLLTMLGISFSIRATDRSRGPGSIQKMVSNHARPFLLMYAEEDESSDNNNVHRWTKEGSMYSTPDANRKSQRPIHSRHTRNVENNAPSTLTNKFPASRASQPHYTTFQDFTMQDSDRRKAKNSKKRKSGSGRLGKALLPDQASSAKDESQEPIPSQGTNADPNMVLPVDASQEACARHQMYVDFDALQWDSHIIAPRGFDAFFCAGDCSFPLYKSGMPSNHATIQGAMNVAGVQPKIPPPCCVPDTLSSLSILFFDEDDSLKLKTYKNMVVESCGCR